MKRVFIAITVLLAILVTVAGALALNGLVSGPYTPSQAEAASNDPHFHNELGYMLAQEGNSLAAQDAFVYAITLDPSYDRARSNLATIAFQNGDYATAIIQLRVLVAQSSNENYRFDLAQNLASQARYVDADLAKLEEAAAIYESLGDFPNAAQNAAVLRAVLAEFS